MISILIPTIDRADFIEKYLVYLQRVGFDGQILIGDSSGDEDYGKTAKLIDRLDAPYEVRQFPCPGMLPHECIRIMVEHISMDYSMWMCDDDIIIPRTCAKCIDFLDRNPEYSSVGGVAIACNFSDAVYDAVGETWRYPIRALEMETGLERVVDLLTSYSVIGYALKRTEQFVAQWPLYEGLEDKAIAAEMLPGIAQAAQGKIKMLDDLFVVRQLHDRRIILPDMLDNILQESWASSARATIDFVAGLVAERDGTPLDRARADIRAAWNQYVATVITANAANGDRKAPGFIRRVIRSRGGARRLVHMYRRRQDPFLLHRLLDSSSPYYEDFRPVYDVITKSV